MTNTDLCPCGSQKKLIECCLPVIQGKRVAGTAEEVMRARYTAFTRSDIDFIMASHHSRTRGEVNREEIESWSKDSKWLSLRIVDVKQGQPSDSRGIVTFRAQYELDGKMTDHWEHALFEKEENEWRFLDAQPLKTQPIVRTPKPGRNDPCNCGSGKKFKKCCGANE